MKFGTSNEELMFKKYEKLKNLRERAEGISIDKLLVKSNDQKTRELLASLSRVDKKCATYSTACNSRSSAKLKRLVGRSGISVDAKQLLRDIEDILTLLIETTHQRGEHEILSPVAFQPSLASIPELTTAHSFTGTWILNFKQKDNSSSKVSVDSCHAGGTDAISGVIASLLKEFGLTYDALFEWWRDHHLDKQHRETVIWNDMRALARKMVFLLEFCADAENVAEIEPETMTECVAEGRSIAIAIIMLVDRYPSKVEKIRRCIELFIPVLFILSECIGALRQCRSKVLDVLGPVVLNLKTIIDYLGGKLLASQELDALAQGASAKCTISEQGRTEILNSGLIRDSSQLDESLERAGEDISAKAREVIARRKRQESATFSIQELKRLQLDRIELEEMPSGYLGSGASGLVRKYYARDRTQQYAVKISKRCDASSDEKRHWNRIVREAEIWVSIDHKNINRLVGFSTIKDSSYPVLVMHVCEENLYDYWSVQSLKIGEKLNFMHDVASGLKYLHENGYAHGDLRPENILIKNSHSPSRRIAVLTDFGVADTTEGAIGQNRISISTDSQRGHENYCAPEFCTNASTGSAMVSKEADMYAFGCVFVVIVCELSLYSDTQVPVQILKQKGVFPVDKQSVSETKLWFLLRSLWAANPHMRPTASNVLLTLSEFIIDSRSSSYL